MKLDDAANLTQSRDAAQDVRILLENGIKRFKGMAQPALNAVSLTLCAGRITGVVGPNGAGKTTLFKVLAGICPLDAGALRFEVAGKQVPDIATALVLEGGRGFYPRLSVEENFKYFSGIARADAAAVRPSELDHWLEKFNLAAKRQAPCRTLSCGMLQRLGLAVAMASNAHLILLDEPTNGLDISESVAFFKLVKEVAASEGKVIAFSSHQPDTILGLAAEVVILREGSVKATLDAAALAPMSQQDFVATYLGILQGGEHG